MKEPYYKHFPGIRSRLYTVVFGTDTPAGRIFDVVLLWAIFISVIVVMLESVQSYKADYGEIFKLLEWAFTILFTVEYVLRIFISRKPTKYIFSYLGIVDLLAVLPSYLAIFITGGSYLMVIRALRLFRVFRILKVTRYVAEAQVLGEALKGSRRKILIFMGAVSTLVMITGTLMYLIEGEANGFTSIPKSIYWAVVTITTVGYGDMIPQTAAGKFFATLMMLTGYAIIAVPTGIMSAELSSKSKNSEKKRSRGPKKVCGNCSTKNPSSANFCYNCGAQLSQRA